MDNNGFAAGDAVNWDFGDHVIYGFVENDVPANTPLLARIEVRDTTRAMWLVERVNLRKTV